jgi:hypothetical protein
MYLTEKSYFIKDTMISLTHVTQTVTLRAMYKKAADSSAQARAVTSKS